MLKFRNQKTPTISFLITTIRTKQHILLPCCIYARQNDFTLIRYQINHRKNKQKIQRQKNVLKHYPGHKKNAIKSGNFRKGCLAN